MTLRTTILDFESYFDQDYSLKKLSTEEYVRDPRFKIHCAAIVSSNGGKQIFTDNFRENLVPYMDDFIICQKSQFDGLILSHHLGLYPKYWGCTLSMARAQLQFLKSHSLEALAKQFGLQGKTIDYNAFKGKRNLDPETMHMLTNGCLNDAELTFEIAQKLLENFPEHELRIIDATIRMFTEPALCLDHARLARELSRIKADKEAALGALQVTKAELQSAKKFCALLEAQGVYVPMKVSLTTGKEIPALAKTDEPMKELLEHENETVAALAAARLGQKSTLMETRCERLLGMDTRGYLPVYLKYHGAHTGRWSGGDKVNFQNFPRGSELRKSILAPKGYKLVGVDSAQIECRLLNWFAGQHNIIDAFRNGRDIYSELAAEFFQRPITKKDENERNFGKEVELASGFNMGWKKLQSRVFQKLRKRLTDEEAERAITIYRTTHPEVTKLWKTFQQVIKDMHKELPPYNIGCVTIDGYRIYMPDKTFLDYTGLYWDGHDFRLGKAKVYGGLVVENIIQKLGRLIVGHAIINVEDKYAYKLGTTTHDDVIYIIPKEDTKALDNIITEFKSPPEWCKDIPLGAEGFESERFDK